MPPAIRLVAAITMSVLCAWALAHAQEPASDRLSIPGPISFGADTYLLSGSSHPSPSDYKQEYLPAGQTSPHFRQMVLIEATLPADVEHAVTDKVEWLEKRKATDPVANFAVLKNPKSGEVILDFLFSSDEPNGDYVVEWDAYRYAPLPRNGGKPGVLLFGISRRAYGDDTTDFLRALKATRPQEIDALAKDKLPPVAVRSAD
jgi:hypothetical protein